MVGTIPDKLHYTKPKGMEVILNVKLPFTIKYKKGELWYGYLCRLAIANGYDSTYSFLQDVNEQKDIQWDYWNQRMGYDCDRPFGDIGNISDGEWLLEGTPLGMMAMLSSRSKLGMYVRNHSWETHKDNQLIPRLSSFVQKLRICPKCREIEGDDWFIHLDHNLPEVTVCHIHECALHVYDGVKGYEMTRNDYHALKPEKEALEYAKFVSKLQEASIECSVIGFQEACKTELNRRDITMKELNDWLGKNASKSLNYNRFYGVDTKEAYIIGKAVFGNADGLISALSKYIENHENDFQEAIKGRYSLVGKYRDTVVRIKCLQCGAIFPETPLSIIQGWGCPECSKVLTSDDIVLQILQKAADKGWTSDFKHFRNWSEVYSFTNKEGLTIRRKLKNFVSMISGEINRPSQRKNKVKQIQRIDKSTQKVKTKNTKEVKTKSTEELRTKIYKDIAENKGFVLESWRTRKRQTVLSLKHKKCGGVFDVLKVNFILSPFCRCCEGIRPRLANKKREALGKEKAEELKEIIEEYCMSRKGNIISNEEIQSLLIGPEKKHVSSYLSSLRKKGKMDLLDSRLWCNHGEEYSIDDIIHAHFNRGVAGYEGLPICDSLFLKLGGTLKNPKRAYVFSDRGKGTAHLDHVDICDVPVVKVPTKIPFDENESYAFAFIMTIWHSDLLSEPKLLNEIYGLLCNQGMQDSDIRKEAGRFPNFIEKKVESFLCRKDKADE